MLYGRERELKVVDDLLSRARQRGHALVVRGDPGIGKSALVAVAASEAREHGFHVLLTTGIQSETELPYAGLHQLMRGIAWDADSLAAPQRAALRAAFGKTSDAAPDRFLVALATLELLAEEASHVPLLVIAEDAQWLDRPTAEVLAFVGRRVESDRVVVLLVVREGAQSVLLEAGLPELHLHELDDASAASLLDAQAPHVAASLRTRILDEARGNPLALLELPVGLASHNPGARGESSVTLPLTARLESAFSARFGELPPTSRVALLVAAFDDASDLAEILTAASLVRGEPVAVDTLTPAVALRLVEVDEKEVRFRHPLIRSAIRQGASLSDRMTVHAALAATTVDEPDRHAWHRAASIIGRDEDAASDLDRVAARARGRGGSIVSVNALERAAELTPDPARRAGRLLRAAELAFELGRRDVVERLVRQVEPLMPLVQDPLERGRLILVRGLGEPRVLQPDRVKSLVEAAQRARDTGDANLAWNLLWRLAQRCFWADPGQEARMQIVNAVGEAGQPNVDPRAVAILAYAAPLERANDVMDRLASWSTDDVGAEGARLLGSAAVVVGAFEQSIPFLVNATTGLRSQGRLAHLARALAMLGWSATCLADWRVALPALDESVRLATETGEAVWAAGARAMQAIFAAQHGEAERAATLTRAAERAVISTGATHMLAYVEVARGLMALAEGRSGDAYDALRRIYDPGSPAHHVVPSCWYIGELAEAAAYSEHRSEARALMAELEPLALQSRSAWIQVAFRYARAQLADDAEAEVRFGEALGHTSQWPMQRARLQLAYGAWLRRKRRAADARTALRTARDTFDALGASPWADRTRQELRAAGEASRKREPAAWDQLSPQEIQIATLAAEGLSNREIGRRLYLSHRTVGSHLYRLFPKLGVTTRGQLAGVLGQS